MAATTRKWYLLIVALNLGVSIIWGYSGGFFSNGITGTTPPTWNNNAVGTNNTINQYNQQDNLRTTDVVTTITYINIGINAGWSAIKLLGLLLVGVPAAAYDTLTIATTYGMNSFIGLTAAFGALLLSILEAFFIFAIWFLFFKPKSD